MIKNKLLKAKKNGQMLEIYTDIKNRDRFHVGYILSVKNGQVFEYNIGIHGEYDGLSVEFIKDIYKLDVNTEYLNDLYILGRKHDLKVNFKNYEYTFLDLLLKAQHDESVSMIWLSLKDEPLIGYISNIVENNITVKLIARKGQYIGDRIVTLENICRVMIDDCDCRDIDILYRYKNA